MTSKASAILLSLLACLFSGCARHAAPEPGSTFEAGTLSFVSTPILDHTFRVTNPRAKPVRILGESHSCGCTKVSLERRTLRPGESIPLGLSIGVAPGFAQNTITCTVLTDDSDQREWTYRVTYRTIRSAVFLPDQLDFGRFDPAVVRERRNSSAPVTPAEVVLRTFQLKRSEPRPKVSKLSCPEGFTITEVSQGAGEEADSEILVRDYKYIVSFNASSASFPQGDHTRYLTAKLTNGTEASLRLSWSVLSPITTVPTQVHFGIAAPRETANEQRLTMSSPERLPFRILRVEGKPWPVTAALKEPDSFPSARRVNHELVLSLATPDDTRTKVMNGSVLVHTDLQSCPLVQIPWTVFVKQP